MFYFHNVWHLRPYICCQSLQKINSASSLCSTKRNVRISLPFESLNTFGQDDSIWVTKVEVIVYFSRVKIYLVAFQLPSWIRYPPTMGPVQLFCSSFKWFRNQSRLCCTTVTLTGASRFSLFISRFYTLSLPRVLQNM